MAAIELPRSSMPLSPEVYESGRALSNYFCNTRKSDHLSSGISLFSLFHLKVMNILASCTQYDSTFFKTMAGYFSEEKDGPISAIFSVFTKSVYADRFTSTYFNSSGTIYCFYRILSNASQKTDSGKNDCSDLIEFIEYIQGYFIANQDDQLSQGLLDFINFCDLSIELLKHNDFELLDKAPIDFGVQAEEIPSDFHYRCSVRNFIYLFSTIHHLLLFLKMEQQINSPFKNNGESINQFLNAQYIATRRELLQNTSIPYQFQVRLYLVLRRSFHRLLKTDYNLEAMKKRFFSPGTLKYYSDTLCSKEAQKISKATVL